MNGLLERAAGLVRDRERRQRTDGHRGTLESMTEQRERRERLAEVERRLTALRLDRDRAVTLYVARLRGELRQALAALNAARGLERRHPSAPYTPAHAPGTPQAIAEAEYVVGLVRAELEAATGGPGE